MKKLFFVLTFSLQYLALSAQKIENLYDENPGPFQTDTITTFEFYTDEDFNPLLLFPKASDQNYTMGLGFGFSSLKFKSWFVFKPITTLDNLIIGKKITRGFSTTELAPSISINGAAFTPDSLRAVDPVPNDRPYAFLLALSTKRGYIDNDRDIVYKTELNIGAFGLDIGKWVQTGIHKSMNDNNTKNPYNPEGWHNQIGKGFAPTFLYALGIDKLIESQSINARSNRSYFDMKLGGAGSMGYYTQLQAAASFRFGLLDSRNWVRDFNPLGNMNKGLGRKNRNLLASQSQKQQFEIYMFAAGRPTFMAYNAMLNGTILGNSIHTLSWKETRHFIMEWNTGIATHIPLNDRNCALDVSWIINAGRTSEINTDLARAHYWGGIYLAASW
ncbi:MAG: hypothetical protein BGO31_12855 [Bacteroidetes bacterium 43-16]|nr:MAG: hypothetical protein BGO31_12855 [Bacteroidetes bacterium 43-16]